ncbi:MAG: hypothetical protein NXI20_22700 [bacterium]|nr:hypothetical protein [bacterium]
MNSLKYLIVSLISLLIGIGIFSIFIFYSSEIINAGYSEKFFYILLIPMALASAGFLFGGMKSYAKYTGKVIGGALELGGPAVLFCLVLIGGFKLVPETEPLKFIIYFEDTAGNSFNLSEATFSLHLLDNPIERKVTNQQYVDFGNIPNKYRLQTADIQITSENWVFGINQLNKVSLKLDKPNHHLSLQLKNKCLSISGMVSKSGPLKEIKVFLDTLQTTTDEYGQFAMKLPKNTINTAHKLRLVHDSIGVLEKDIYPCIDNKIIIQL